jgi:hypothetical protein
VLRLRRLILDLCHDESPFARPTVLPACSGVAAA